MKKRIDLLKTTHRCYTFQTYAASSLHQALQNLNIPSRIIALEQGKVGSYFQEIMENPPMMTCSFKHLFPNQQPLYAITAQPHLLIPHHSLGGSLSYLKHPLGKICIPDRASAVYLQKNGSANIHFVPSPAPTCNSSLKQRIYDVVLFNDLINIHDLFKTWKIIFSPKEAVMLQKTLTKLEENPSYLPIEALIEELHQTEIDSAKGSIDNWLLALEEALPVQQTLTLLDAIPNLNIHLFGGHIGNRWLKKLKNRKAIFLHGVLPFILHFEVLKQAKILVRTPHPSFDGSDPWILSALALGCLVLTPKNAFLEEMLGKDSPLFYPREDYKTLEEKLHFFLEQDEKRKEVVQSYLPLMERYNWDQFTQKLFDEDSCL